MGRMVQGVADGTAFSVRRRNPGALTAWTAGLRSDAGRYPLPTQGLRALRRTRIAVAGPGFAGLAGLPSFDAHVAGAGEGDPLFFLSHRHYLVQGLTARGRLRAALAHYGHEHRSFDAAYQDQVYRRGALDLWAATVAGVRYTITLEPGQDVAHEGGVSVVLNVDGGRVCVLSLSVVPGVLLGSGLPDLLHFVTRKQLAQDRTYQSAFHRAFDRVTPAHLCFAAVEGLILAQGLTHAFGIAPDRHPACTPALTPGFEVAYADFWRSLGGVQVSAFGYLIGLPMALTPLDALDAAKRKRALVRRGHLAAVQAAARATIARHLLGGPGDQPKN